MPTPWNLATAASPSTFLGKNNMEYIIYLNFVLIFVSLWVAFGKRFRPIDWTTFYMNIFAAGINTFVVIFHLINIAAPQ